MFRCSIVSHRSGCRINYLKLNNNSRIRSIRGWNSYLVRNRFFNQPNNINSCSFLLQYRSIGSSKSTNDQSNSDIDHISILRKLTTYIWPTTNSSDSTYIKSRVCASLILLIASKSVNIYVPFIFKNLVDELQTTGFRNNLFVSQYPI
jgi:ABC transporter ATM